MSRDAIWDAASSRTREFATEHGGNWFLTIAGPPRMRVIFQTPEFRMGALVFQSEAIAWQESPDINPRERFVYGAAESAEGELPRFQAWLETRLAEFLSAQGASG